MNPTWHPPGETVRLGELALIGGMFYSCAKSPDWPGEPSAIISSAQVAQRSADPVAELSCALDYNCLSPGQRRSYLLWLAKGRRDKDPSQRAFGYLMLFLYGMERRILLERDKDPALVEELISLIQLYFPFQKSRTFQRCFLSLAHYAGRGLDSNFYRQIWPRLLANDEGKTSHAAMELVLDNLFELKEAMHWSIAYRVAMADPTSLKSVVTTKAKEEFWALFAKRYHEEYSGGLVLRASPQPAEFRYEPASYPLKAVVPQEDPWPYRITIANVKVLASQFRKVIRIWDGSIRDLSGYTRAVSTKSRTDSDGVKTWLLLPAELRLGKPNPMKTFWDWVELHAPREGEFFFVTVGALAPWFGISERAKLSKEQSSQIAYGISSMGWNVAPHPDHIDQAYGWTQEVAMFPRSDTKVLEPQTAGLVRLLYLVIPIAAADGVVDASELDAFYRIIGHEITSDHDRRYIKAVEASLLRDTNVALSCLSSMTAHVTQASRSKVLHLLVHIAAADGEVDQAEFRMLRKIAREFGLADDAAERILEGDLAFSEVIVSKAKPAGRRGESIPSKALEENKSPGLQLDMARVAALTRETHEVVALLASVMSEEECAPRTLGRVSPPPSSAPSTNPPDWVRDIDRRYQQALILISAHEEMEIEKFNELSSGFHLMPDDLFNGINAWADEILGDFLLERTETIRVYRHLILAFSSK